MEEAKRAARSDHELCPYDGLNLTATSCARGPSAKKVFSKDFREGVEGEGEDGVWDDGVAGKVGRRCEVEPKDDEGDTGEELS